MSKPRTTAQLLQDSLWAGQNMGSLMTERDALICCLAEGVCAMMRRAPEPPAPEGEADEFALLLLGDRASRYWATPERYDWRAAHIASWDIPVACCIKCRRGECASGGLTCRHTTHRHCWPAAFRAGAECWCPGPYKCSPMPGASEDAP